MTFLGGASDDAPTAVAVDSDGNVYVVGSTGSSNFPVTPSAYLLQMSTVAPSGFAAKISSDGRSLLYSTYLPGTPNALAVSNAGEAYMGGAFASTVVTPGALGTGENPSYDDGVFLLRLNSTGTGLVFGAYLGGDGFNGSTTASLAISPQGNVYVAGFTFQSDILTTANAFQGNYTGTGPTVGPGGSGPGSAGFCCSNGFVVGVNSTGSQLLYGTYFGPQYSGTAITSIAAPSDGYLYLSGSIDTTALWATPGAYLSTPSSNFIAKLAPGQPALDAFSYLALQASWTHVEVGNVPQTVHISFGEGVIEMSTSTLALVSSFSPSSALGGASFGASGSALAAPQSVWLVGGCGSPCSLISSNAFQATPQNPSSSAVLIQLTDETLAINSVVNAASFLGGPVSPGEIVTITGAAIGPTTPATLTLDQTGKVATSLSGVQVLFSGTAAPLTYVSATQINCVVPYEVQGLVSPYAQISYQGQTSSVFPLAPAAAAPALFTANGSGTGPVAALNQDDSYNSPNTPAAKGSYVVFYLTGEGQTSPGGVTGKVTTVSPTPPLTPQPLLLVAVLINGQPASVAFYGEAPGLVSGVMQLNVQIPVNAPSGNLPLQVSVGGNASQNGVTISVR